MTSDDALVSDLNDGCQRFLLRVEPIRPELHRYCARMMGSVCDGEDVVQDALARAYYMASQMEALPPLRPWLFRIAHNRAIDLLRRYERRMVEPLDEHSHQDTLDDDLDPEDALVRAEATQLAIERFVALPPAQRSCLILKDVLDHSLLEIAALLDLSLPAVKAALHRARARLRALQSSADPDRGARHLPGASSPEIARYAALFNARDWDGVRAMLAEDVRLDLVARAQREGALQVGSYFTNYDRVQGWRLAPAWLEGREVLAAWHHPDDELPTYFIALTFSTGRLIFIQDFRYASYITQEVTFNLPP